MSKDLVYQKQEKVSGNHVNYYLTEIIDRLGKSIVAEAEDIIEFLGMNFALATVFKAVWRMCKLRQDLGKPGSSMQYEAQKVHYYAQRCLAFSQQAQHRYTVVGRFLRILVNLVTGNNVFKPISDSITIAKPKRLEPYSFVIEDMVASLKPTKLEKGVLMLSLRLAQARQHPGYLFKEELSFAHNLLEVGKKLDQREIIANNPNPRPSRSSIAGEGHRGE